VDIELARLPKAIGSLISVLVLPAASTRGEPCRIIAPLLDALLVVLRLDFAYARFSDSSAKVPIVLGRMGRSNEAMGELEGAVAASLTDPSQASPFVVQREVCDGQASIARLRLGFHDEMGCVVAGSRRAGFPTVMERFVLRVVANQATVSLQEALLAEQQRVAEDLQRKVAQQTRALYVKNIELERALKEIQELNAKPPLASTTLREKASIPRGGLAPWQAQRAKELMNANLDGKLPLSRLAEECGLSTRHFARAFRQTTGVPPHRWLLGRRVDRAKDLLHDPALSLAEVALACGFADQSHFTRMFTTVVGLSPGLWRRMRSRKLPLDMAGNDADDDGRVEQAGVSFSRLQPSGSCAVPADAHAN
jgi:AraC-like DNA-binding protein